MSSAPTSSAASRTDPEQLSDEELVDAYAEAAEAPESEYSVADYDAIVQEMAERFEASVLNSADGE